MLFWSCQIISGGGIIGKLFRVIFACGITWSHIFRPQFVSYMHRTNTKWSFNVCISCYILFSKTRLGVTIWYMKTMPMIFLFSAARYSLSNMWNVYWNPFLVRKLAETKNSYTISVPSPVFHWFWWYIDT